MLEKERMLQAETGAKGSFKAFIRYSSLGIEMGLSVAIGIAIGYFLDRYFETYPYLTIVFMLFGVASGLRTVYRLLKRLEKESEGNNG